MLYASNVQVPTINSDYIDVKEIILIVTQINFETISNYYHIKPLCVRYLIIVTHNQLLFIVIYVTTT